MTASSPPLPPSWGTNGRNLEKVLPEIGHRHFEQCAQRGDAGTIPPNITAISLDG
jgi:hypothetical protein